MAEITVENPNFKLKDFVKVLKKRIHNEDWAIIPDAEDIDDRTFAIGITKSGNVVVISGIHEVSPEYNRLKIYIMVDLKGVKVTMTAIDVSTKVLTAVGVLATGGLGIAVAAGKFAFSKLLNFQKRRHLEGMWKKIIKDVIEEDLRYEGKVIEDFYLGLPPVDDDDRLLWNPTYKTYLDLVEMKLRRRLYSYRNLGYNEFAVFRDKGFRDGVVDIVGHALKVNKKKIQEAVVAFVLTNRKENMQPFTVSEIAQIVNKMDSFAHQKYGADGGIIRTFCIFVSATEPEFDTQLFQFLKQNYHVLGSTSNKIPLIFVVPPLEEYEEIEEEKEGAISGFFGKIISTSKKIISEVTRGKKEEIWHNLYVPDSGTLFSIFSKIPFAGMLPVAGKDEVMKHKLEKMKPEQYRELLDQFLFEWDEILMPQNARSYLDLSHFMQARTQMDSEFQQVG